MLLLPLLWRFIRTHKSTGVLCTTLCIFGTKSEMLNNPANFSFWIFWHFSIEILIHKMSVLFPRWFSKWKIVKTPTHLKVSNIKYWSVKCTYGVPHILIIFGNTANYISSHLITFYPVRSHLSSHRVSSFLQYRLLKGIGARDGFQSRYRDTCISCVWIHVCCMYVYITSTHCSNLQRKKTPDVKGSLVN